MHPITSQLNKCQNFMAFWGVILYRIQSFLFPRTDLNFGHLLSCDTVGYTVACNECIIISCALCNGDSFYKTSLKLMIFKSPGGHSGP